MSRILLIEPDLMLRHALTIALFPEHQVAAASAVPDWAAQDLDLLIVDAGALQERSLLSARERARLQKMELPLLWFGPDAALPDCDRDRWLRLQAPLNKEDLRRGLAQCLGATGPTKVPAGQAEQAPDDVAVKSERKARKKINTEANTGKKLIELVEVVDDEPA